MLYKCFRFFFRTVFHFFFKRVEVIGLENIPSEGPCIFAGNHPNSLIDPLIILSQCERPISFAAKDVLFQSRFLRFFMNHLGAVPIKRKQDHQEKQIDNSDAFDSLCNVLQEGRCIGIFPEGISHTGSELAQIKTGTARIALKTLEKAPNQTLSIIPVGLTFLHRHRVRSQVLVHFGKPILVRHQDFTNARELTEWLEESLRSVTLNAPDWSTFRALHAARRIYCPVNKKLSLPEYAELTRRLSDGYASIPSDHPAQKLRLEIEQYQDELDSLGLRDYDLTKTLSKSNLVAQMVRRYLWQWLLLPFLVPGFLLHSPIVFLAIIAGDGLTQRKDVVATTKLIVSILSIPLLYCVLSLLVGAFYSVPWGLSCLLLLPFSGYATIRFLENHITLRKSVRSFLRLILHKNRIGELLQLREDLERRLHAVVDTFHDPSQPRLLPSKQWSDSQQ